MIAGTGSSVGKTTIATGLMRVLKKKGLRVQPFKVGPDFIDPSYHSIAANRSSRNLDSFLMSEPQIRWIFSNSSNDCDIAIVEGVRGLYEGLSPTEDIGSTAHIAKILKIPVILVLDIRGITKSAAAHVLGFKNLDPSINIAGIILNQSRSKVHAEKATKAIEKFTQIPVVGAIPHEPEQELEQRHLGLIPMAEYEEKEKIITSLSQHVGNNIALDQIVDISKTCEEIQENQKCPWNVDEELKSQKIKAAIAKDAAFNFYYQDNLDALSENGANIIEYSPVNGESLPDADCYMFGGGFPEIHAKKIAQNITFLKELKNKVKEGYPILAECGGLMLLGRNLITIDGIYHKFAGIIPSDVMMTTRRQGLSYVEATTTQNHPFIKPNTPIKGHEFHYSKFGKIRNESFGYEILRGKGINGSHDGICINNSIASFLHLHVASYPNLLSDFLKLAIKRKD